MIMIEPSKNLIGILKIVTTVNSRAPCQLVTLLVALWGCPIVLINFKNVILYSFSSSFHQLSCNTFLMRINVFYFTYFRTCPRWEGCIENECHFLVACAIYTSRDIGFQKIEEKYPSLVELDNENKFMFLLSQEDKEANKLLAACIHEWFIIH